MATLRKLCHNFEIHESVIDFPFSKGMHAKLKNIAFHVLELLNVLQSFFFAVMCLSIGTLKNNKFSICSKWKIYYFSVSQNLGEITA